MRSQSHLLRRRAIRAIGPLCAMFPTLVLLATTPAAVAQCRTWSVIGDASPNGPVRALVTLPNGDLIAGGTFTSIGESNAELVARWDGSQWSTIGEGLRMGRVSSLARTASGFVAAGSFRIGTSDVTHGVAEWNGTAWRALDGGWPNVYPPHGPGYPHFDAIRVAVLPNQNIVVASRDSNRNLNVSLWNGSAWSAIGQASQSTAFDPDSQPGIAVMPNGDVVVGGIFESINGVAARNVARWNGTEWSAMGGGLNANVSSLFTARSGAVIAGGDWRTSQGDVGHWTGSAWESLTIGLISASTDAVFTATQHPTGPLVLGGELSPSTFGATGNIAIQNGPYWLSFGSGPSRDVLAVETMPNGDIVAGGDFTITAGNPWPYLARLATCLCPADRDNGQGWGERDDAVTIDDLLYYLTRFEQGTWEADLDNDGDLSLGQPDGGVTIDDLLYFLGRFEMGC